MTDEAPLIRVESVSRRFAAAGRGGDVQAVDSASLELAPNTIASLVGESGSGKTTLARIMLGLLRPTSGRVVYRERDTAGFGRRERIEYWRNVQGVFQDPYSAFNQFFHVRKMLADALNLVRPTPRGRQREDRIAQALDAVNLEAGEVLGRFPSELSGGQGQRLMIARVFLVQPAVVIADEPTSMIDACSRISVLNALLGLRERQGTSILFVTHDMGLAYHVSDTVHIMSRGRIVESGSAEQVMNDPRHPYTRRLLADVPRLHGTWL
jgi:peptide/nickel transport system ATP-binding protein